MQTRFPPEALEDPAMARSESILRKCVHCGFCTATCPTYKLLGDELDGPRGRIYLIKEMFERGEPADARVARHVDRCLSCLSCSTTCPSGVDYMRLIDHARAHVEATYRRPWADRALRWLLLRLIPHPARFRLALAAAWPARLFRFAIPATGPTARLRAMLDLAPARGPAPPSRFDDPGARPAQGSRRMRIALLTGCAQKALDASINEATVRLLTRHGVEVVIAKSGCCGSMPEHVGEPERARAFARANVRAWRAAETEHGPLDAIVANASGCGTTLKDYGHMLDGDADGAWVAGLAKDVSEVIAELDIEVLPERTGLRIAYQCPCSMQHGQKIAQTPAAVLRRAGFRVATPKEAHLCCGSAGIYNILQPEIAKPLGEDKAATLNALSADLVVSGNLGCMTQLEGRLSAPIVHLVQLLDWASGGPASWRSALEEEAA